MRLHRSSFVLAEFFFVTTTAQTGRGNYPPIVGRESNDHAYCSQDDNNGVPYQVTYPIRLETAISCEIAGTGVPCENHLRVRRVDCPRNSEMLVPITLRYSFCNAEETEQKAFNKVVTKYKGKDITQDNIDLTVLPLTCRTQISPAVVDLCTTGASAHIRYSPVNSLGQYCYSYSFYQVRKKWLLSGKCNTETSIQCTILSRDREGKPCKGNIFRETDPARCEKIRVEFKWEVCNFYNTPDSEANSDEYLYKFNTGHPGKTYARFNGEDISFNFNDLPASELCRSVRRRDVIDTCSTEGTPASFKVGGKLVGAGEPAQCGYFSSISVKPSLDLKCGFIITEIADPIGGSFHRFIEIYATNEDCHGEDVTEEQYLGIYRSGKTKVDRRYPIPIKGVTVGDDGFIVFCSSNEGMKYYGKNNYFSKKHMCDDVVGELTAANTSGNSVIAILIGDLDKDPVISDVYGVIGSEGRNTNNDFKDGRAVRNCKYNTPNLGNFAHSQFDVQKRKRSADMNPHFWFNTILDNGLGTVCTGSP